MIFKSFQSSCQTPYLPRIYRRIYRHYSKIGIGIDIDVG